jgi:hypothetical protein
MGKSRIARRQPLTFAQKVMIRGPKGLQTWQGFGNHTRKKSSRKPRYDRRKEEG